MFSIAFTTRDIDDVVEEYTGIDILICKDGAIRMSDFIIEGKKIRLKPLDKTGIEERVVWNTTLIEWKKEESGSTSVQSIDENNYRRKKEREIKFNERFVDGIYTSLEIYTLTNQHIGFINCYPFHKDDLSADAVAIGIVIPDRKERSRGHGTEALKLYSEYLFKNGKEKVTLITRAENKAMQIVGEKCGFNKHTLLSDGRLLLTKEERG